MDVKATFFKESGKYYTDETIRVPEELSTVSEVHGYIRENTSHRGMHLVAMMDEIPGGFPLMIPADQRR